VDSNHFRNMIANARANTVVRIVILRNNEPLRFEIRLDERPKNLSRRFTPTTPQTPPLEQDNPLGIVVQELTAEIARQFGLQVESGVVIREVAAGSPAAEAGLRAGLLIQEIDSKLVATLEDFRTAIADVDLEKGVLLYITSESGGRYIVIRNR
jgi:serine protease Do